jgi:hypothetical protein
MWKACKKRMAVYDNRDRKETFIPIRPATMAEKMFSFIG